MTEISQGVLMVAAISGQPIMINGELYEVEMELEGEIIRKDGTIEKIQGRYDK
jgi:hypothetical protein